MNQTKDKKPTVEIVSPNGEIIRIFQELSPEYMKELIDVFMERDDVRSKVSKKEQPL